MLIFLTPQYHDYLIGIIKHELCHYHLHRLGLGYQHKDRDFKTLLQKVGGSCYAPDIGLRRQKKNIIIFMFAQTAVCIILACAKSIREDIAAVNARGPCV